MMNLNALKIDPEFQGKIPPLNFEEEQQLEQNILHEGRLLNPIIIWNGFILDGHTRYRILRKHPFIAYQIQEIELDNRYAALSWICQNQLGRRNLDPERKKFLMGKLYESEKLARGGSKERAHDENGRFTSMVQNDPLRAKQLSTCERIAAQNGVGAATVKRAEKYAKGVDARVFIVEIMGHKVGSLTLHAGIAGGADIILIPEIPYDIKKVCAAIEKRNKAGKRFTILAVAEGAISKEDAELPKKKYKEKLAERAKKYPSVSYEIADQIQQVTGSEVRITVPGHMQRGGEPCAYDRVLSTRIQDSLPSQYHLSIRHGMLHNHCPLSPENSS